jgi:nucleoid DNA-binding protein
MTKKELIDEVNARAADDGIDLTKKDTRTLIEILFETVGDTIEDEERFRFPDFGTFKVKFRKAREGRNPQTGEPIQIPASNTVRFKPAPSMKDRINPPE